MYEDKDIKLDGDTPERLTKFRRWFQAAVEASNTWRKEALEDYEFVCGKQWTDGEIEKFRKQGKAPIVINRIAPLINIVSGYQMLNRYDVDFLARTADDVELCQVRRGMTKYVFDRCNYDAVESQAFRDMCIGGLGWFGVKFKYDSEIDDGEAYIERVDPFSMYIDPEAHELDFSDAKYIFRAKWADKDELKTVYTEQADAIESAFALYDEIEEDNGNKQDIDPTWYNSELRKVRLIECWYKVREIQKRWQTVTGETIDETQETRQQISELIRQGAIIQKPQEVPTNRVKVCIFFDRTLLEDRVSPYQHGEFPYVPLVFKYYGVGDVPAGFVRDLKNPQREVNKRRTQELHLLNVSGNGGGWIREGAMTPEQEAEFKEKGAQPGHFQKAVDIDGIRERHPINTPTAIVNAENQAVSDLQSISGINEQLLGTDIPTSASGRAIELRQKQAITHLARVFDSLRSAKKKIANILWGRRGHAGLIPQYYTESKIYRIEGENGQQFIPINQQVIQQDPIAGIIVQTVNDLSQGEFDVVISDVESSTTQRQAQLWNLVDGVSKLNIPGDMVFDVLIDLSDLPRKNDIKERWQQRQQQAQQQAQQQMQTQIEIERIKNENLNQSIAFKDASPPIQLLMAIKAGLIPQEYVQQLLPLAMQQLAPQAMPQQQIPQQQMSPQMMIPQMPPMQQTPQNSPPLTDAAVNGIREQLTPAV